MGFFTYCFSSVLNCRKNTFKNTCMFLNVTWNFYMHFFLPFFILGRNVHAFFLAFFFFLSPIEKSVGKKKHKKKSIPRAFSILEKKTPLYKKTKTKNVVFFYKTLKSAKKHKSCFQYECQQQCRDIIYIINNATYL